MQVYQHPTEDRTFFAPDVAPTVGAELPILSVSGLTNFALPHSLLKHAPADAHGDTTGSGSGGQFYGSDFRAAYYGNGPLTAAGKLSHSPNSGSGTWRMCRRISARSGSR